MTASAVRFKLNGWIGVDLDGTLSLHEQGLNVNKEIGDPIPIMAERVKSWLRQGWEVRIMTARVSSKLPEVYRDEQRKLISAWTKVHIGTALPAVSEKDFNMLEVWDDRARRVEHNTGRIIG